MWINNAILYRGKSLLELSGYQACPLGLGKRKKVHWGGRRNGQREKEDGAQGHFA